MAEEKEAKKNIGNSILVSKKPIDSYILACMRASKENTEIVIRARGKNILVAVNLAEIVKRDGLKIKDIKIGTDRFTPKDSQREVALSTIDITMIK